MSVNLYNATTDTLKNIAGDIINPKSVNEMIAPIEDGTASKSYAVGEQFIMNDLLCEATQAIAQGDTMVIGTNCEESEQLSKQVKDINTSLTANGNRFEAGYSSANDEYGFNIGSTFYPIGASSGGGDGVVPLLDLDNAVVLTTTAYTCTKDGAIVGGIYGGGSGVSVLVNNKTVAESASYLPVFVSGIEKGSSIRLSNNNSYTCYFAPYTYATVDPTVTVYNEVEVTLDYANPLFTFNTNNLSYTATKKCYLAGTIPGLWDGFINLSIDGTLVYQSSYSNSVGQAKPIPILTIEKGSTVSLNRWSGSSECLHVFDGTVTGSVGALHSDIPDYSNLIASLAYNGGTYTATQECIVEMKFMSSSNSNRGSVSVNGNEIGWSFRDTIDYCNFDKSIHLQKGDVLTWTNAHQTYFTGNVFGVL